MTADDRAQHLATLLRKLKSAYKPDEHTARPPVDELVYSMLLWDSTTAKADRAFKRVTDMCADFNELRVFRPDHLEEVLGERYPNGAERARRMVTVLRALYTREHAVTLDPIAAMPKRDARKLLESLEGMPPFVAARVALLALGVHAVPLEDRLLRPLIAEGVLEDEPNPDVGRASGVLERMVKAGEAVATYTLLQAWAEDGAPTPVASRAAKGAGGAKSAARPAGKKASTPRGRQAGKKTSAR